MQLSLNILFWILGFMSARFFSEKLTKKSLERICCLIFSLIILFHIYDLAANSSYFYKILSSDTINSKEEFSYFLRHVFIYGMPQPLRFFFGILSLFILILQIPLLSYGTGFIFSIILRDKKEFCKSE